MTAQLNTVHYLQYIDFEFDYLNESIQFRNEGRITILSPNTTVIKRTTVDYVIFVQTRYNRNNHSILIIKTDAD